MKISQRPALDSGTAVVLQGESIELALADGPVTIAFSDTNDGTIQTWDDKSRTFTVYGGSQRGAASGAQGPGGKWSLRVACYAIGEKPTARVVHWTVV